MTSTIPHQAIYRRWRAQTFSQIVGQEAVVATLRNAVRSGRVSHAILFVGPRGTGKTSLARILAKALNCTNLQDGDPCDACPACVAIREGTTLDVIEIDAASNRGINEVRELRDRLQYAPSSLRRKVYILDEAHQITKDAWNALLKSLEEPPDFVVFMFASTHPQDFPPAILSRLQRYDVRRLTTTEIEGKLERILAADGHAAEPGALRLIARLAAGGMRDAESMLDQLLSSTAGRLDESSVRDLLGLAEADAIERFIGALVARDPVSGIAVLDELEDRGRDLRTFVDQVAEGIRSALVGGLAAGAAPGRQAGLIAAARGLSGIDPSRAGIGGLRLQLELALFGQGVAADPGADPLETRPVIERSGPGSQMAARPAALAGPVSDPVPARASGPSSPPPAPATDQPAWQSHASAAPPGDLPGRPAAMPRVSPLRDDARPSPAVASTHGLAAFPSPSGQDAPPAPTQAGAPRTSDLARLRELWPQIVAHISAHPPTRPLIIACRPISVEGNIVTLGFPEDQAFLKDVAFRRRPNLESGIGQFLGHEVNVRCVATNLDAVAVQTANSDAAFLLEEARRIFADDIVEPGEVR